MTKYFLGSAITLLTIFVIAKFFYKEEKTVKRINPYRYSQSAIHHLVNPFIPKNKIVKEKKISQTRKHFDKTNIRVIIVEDEAYWIKDNIFYTAAMTDEGVDKDTTSVVDTMGMNKVQLDKMLFIIDQLRDGKQHDSGSSGY
jgi:hypothetical protein